MNNGPAEKQVLLLKIQHELENAPKFGKNYVADADSEPQKWIARVGALLSRLSISHGVKFQTTLHTSVQYWSLSREDIRRQLSAAAEELRLELELDGREEIGQVYGNNQHYDFLLDLEEIIRSANTEVFVIDPYFNGQAFATYLRPVGGKCAIRVLCSKYSSEVAGHMTAFNAQYQCQPELRKNRDLHDRLVIIDKQDCWVVGGSIKDAGKKPTYLVPLPPAISGKKIEIYERLWGQSISIDATAD